MDNRVGIDCGSRVWAGQKRAKGGNWENCNRIIIKKSALETKRNKKQVNKTKTGTEKKLMVAKEEVSQGDG